MVHDPSHNLAFRLEYYKYIFAAHPIFCGRNYVDVDEGGQNVSRIREWYGKSPKRRTHFYGNLFSSRGYVNPCWQFTKDAITVFLMFIFVSFSVLFWYLVVVSIVLCIKLMNTRGNNTIHQGVVYHTAEERAKLNQVNMHTGPIQPVVWDYWHRNSILFTANLFSTYSMQSIF